MSDLPQNAHSSITAPLIMLSPAVMAVQEKGISMQLEPKPSDASEARRRFLTTCGKFAVATPPAIALLLASAERNFAVAQSGDRDPDHDGDVDVGGPPHHE